MSALVHDTSIVFLVTVLAGFSIGFLFPVSLQETFHPEWHAGFQICFFLGAIFGAGLWTALFHQRPRVPSMQFTCLVAFIGWMLIWTCSSGQLGASFSINLLFLCGRTITGVACSILVCAASIHLFEIAPDAWIGTFGCLPWLGLTVAMGLTQIVNLSISWHLLALMCAFLALVLHLLLCRVSESDKFVNCITSEQFEARPLLESEESSGKPTSESESNPADKLASGIQSGSAQNGQSLRITAKVRYVTLWLALLQQLTGAQILVYLAELLYQFSPGRWSLGYGWMIGLPQLLCGLVASLSSNRIALVHLLRSSAVAMAIIHLGLGYLVMCPHMKPVSTLMIVCIILGLCAHAIGWGPFPLLIVNRLFPTEKRGRAVGWAMTISFLVNMCMTMLFEPFITLYGIGTYFWILSALCLCAFFWVQFFLTGVNSPDMNLSPVQLKVPTLPYLNGKLLKFGQVIQVDTGSVFKLVRRNLLWNSRPKGV